MGAAGRQAHHQRGASSSWPALLAGAAVALAFATLYLCVSIRQALEGSEDLPVAFAGEQQPAAVQPSATLAPAADSSGGAPEAPAALDPQPDADLKQVLVQAAGENAEHVGISVLRPGDGKSAALNGDTRFYAASTFKLAVLYEAERRISAGELSYEDRITMTEEDLEQDLGTAGFLDIADDGSISIRDMLTPMIEVSDNSSAVALMHFLGTAAIDRTLRALDVHNMTLNTEELWTTADDLARLMEAVYTGAGVAPEQRDHMRDLLLHQTIRGGIPAALGDEVDAGLLIGNKTGTWESAQHDVAFVEAAGGAYIIAILTDGSYEGWEAMHRIARAVQIFMVQHP